MMLFALSHPQMDEQAWAGVPVLKSRIGRNGTLGWEWICAAHDVTRPSRLELDFPMLRNGSFLSHETPS